MKKERIYDCFCYFNEDMLLELRLKTLWDVVDIFVIVEASYTQSGHPKPLNFSQARFEPYLTKIRYVTSTDCPGGTENPWLNENHQRNEISRGLLDASPLDRIIVSDLDEIPKPESIQSYDPLYLRGDFQQRYYSYFLNNLLVEPIRDVVWRGSKITLKKHLDDFYGGKVNSVRSYKSTGLLRSLKRTWFRWFQTQKISDGGWHFTWVMPHADILKKMDAMAHRENDRQEWRKAAYIQSTINGGRDIVRPDRRYEVVGLDGSFPLPLQSNVNDYKDYLRLPDLSRLQRQKAS